MSAQLHEVGLPSYFDGIKELLTSITQNTLESIPVVIPSKIS